MKKILLTLAAIAMVFAGCTKGFEERLTNLENRVSELEAFVTNLNAEVEGIQTIVSNLQKNVYVTGVEPIKNASGVEIGYKLTFNQGNPIEIKHGNTGAIGETGAAGKTPTIDLYEGEWYWRHSGGDWIKDSQDNMIPVTEEIEFSVKDGVLYITINGEEKALGSVKGEQGDSMFEGVTVNEEEGTVIIDLKGTDNDLVLPFNAAAAEEEFELNLNLPASTEVLLGGTIEFSYTLVGCAAADAAVFVQTPEDWTVELDETAQKVVLTVGEKAGRVVVYAINNVSGEVRAKFVAYDPARMLVVGVKETEFYLDPTGGEIVIPVSSGVAYKTNVSASWLTVEKAPATKAVEHTVVTIKADKNIEGKAREAEVLISRVSDGAIVLTFTVSQESVLMSLIQDEEGNPIKWEETFGVYGDLAAAQAGTNPRFSYKNTFTIELSDDFSKGTYKLNGAFVENNSYTGKTGGVYYANYEDGKFYVKKSSNGYAFDVENDKGEKTDIVILNYDENAKEFTADPIKFGYKFDNADMRDGGYIGGYKAVVKVEAPASDADWSKLYGVYNEETKAPYSYGNPETLVVTESDNSDYDLKMKFYYTEGEGSTSYETGYGKVNTDGTEITVTFTTSSILGPVSAATVLTVSGNTISGTINTDYSGSVQYSASKPAAFDVSSLYGEWKEETRAPYSTSDPETLLISESDDDDYDVKMLFYYTVDQTSHEVGYGKVNADGTEITVTFTTSSILGPVSAATVFTVSGNTISGTINTDHMGGVTYSATKK